MHNFDYGSQRSEIANFSRQNIEHNCVGSANTCFPTMKCKKCWPSDQSSKIWLSIFRKNISAKLIIRQQLMRLWQTQSYIRKFAVHRERHGYSGIMWSILHRVINEIMSASVYILTLSNCLIKSNTIFINDKQN